MDHTSMNYWFPRIEAAGLPVPRTIMVPMGKDEQRDVWRLFDGEAPTEASRPFVERIKVAADEIGYPCFLRTTHTSGKHDWKNTCFLANADQILGHAANIIEYGEINGGLGGMPHDCWAVREYLPVIHLGVCPHFGDMPVCREFRVFVSDGDIECWHPYWPMEALEQGGLENMQAVFDELCKCNPYDFLSHASLAGAACGGRWSVDLLETKRGYVLTDMAEADASYHWQPCSGRFDSKTMRML